MNLFFQLLANGLVSASLYAMLAIGFGIILRTLNVFHVAYGGFFVLSAYVFFVLVAYVKVPFLFSFFITIVLAGILGWLAEKIVFKPFFIRRASFGATLIASLGMNIVIENLLALAFGNELKTIYVGRTDFYKIGSVVLSEIQIIQLIVGLTVVSLIWLLFKQNRLFKALWAMGDQPELISAFGWPIFLLRSIGVVIGTTISAIPACLMCVDLGIEPNMGMSYMLIAAVAVLIGGLNSYTGWVIGAIVIAVLQSLSVWKLSSHWMDLVTFSLLILILVLGPNGLMERGKGVEERS